MLYEMGLLKAQAFVGLPSGEGGIYLKDFGLANGYVHLEFRYILYLKMW